MNRTLLFAAALCITSAAHGQMIDADKVPPTVKKTFEARYPGVTPQWEYEEGKFDAEFKQDGKKVEILFDRQGNSAQKISEAEAPSEMQKYLSQLKDEKLKKVKRLVSAGGDISYLAICKSKSLLFDAKGAFLRESKE